MKVSPLLAIAAAIAGTTASAQEPGAGHAFPAPTVAIGRVTTPPVIDGILDEALWQALSPATDFVQQNPYEGEPATQRTEVRFAMDDNALYVGARMYDTMGSDGVRARLTRRDQTSMGDRIEIALDTFHDHSGRTVFWINPAGVKYDAGQAAPNIDASWDPVWTAGTRIDSLGWTAELRIPLSQLRFPRRDEQIWGLQVWRYVERLNEVSLWSFWRKDESGGVSRYGHLTGIEAPRRSRSFEVLPYTTGRAAYQIPTQPGSPFERPREYAIVAGADVKAMLSSSLTLAATINPDFGQVEVDPATVNLSAYETFLSEKRPFFIEGNGLFGFGGGDCIFCNNFNGMSLFYSRRIGRHPQGTITMPTRYVDVPENSRILGAVKVAARTGSGTQIGVLNAVTASEQARVITEAGQSIRREVEPLTNYLVARLRQTRSDGNLAFGMMATSVLRKFEDEPLSRALPTRATAVGADVRYRFHADTYVLSANVAVSEVGGDSTAIRKLQESSARYFQRPDRDHGGNGIFSDAFDTEARALRGIGGFARLSKEAGVFRWEGAVNFRSPGFEVNDLAFQTSADYVWMNANVAGIWTEPTSWYRELVVIAGGEQQYNFDGDLTRRDVRVYLGTETLGYWKANAFALYIPETFDDRLTRGGPVVRREQRWFFRGNLSTDSRRAVSLNTNPHYSRDASGVYEYSVNLNVNVRPASNVNLSLGPRYARTGSGTQFVERFPDESATHFHGQRVVFADLEQHGVSMEARAAVAMTPTLTFEAYVQPLISTGRYSRFKEFDAPRTTATTVYDADRIGLVSDGEGRTSYVLNPDRDPATPGFTFRNPDFNVRSLRGNAVLRWEYRPGSTLFLVWQQSRSGTEPFGDLDVSRDLAGILDQRPDNIFMAKVTYWLGR